MRKPFSVLTLAVALSTGLHCRMSPGVDNSDGNGTPSRTGAAREVGVTTIVEIDPDLGESRWPGEAEATKTIAELIGRSIEKSYPPEKRPARRDVHPKAHGTVRARFTVNAELPENLAHGVFVPGKAYDAWIRFSNGSSDPSRADVKGDARGMAIKLMGVPGAKLLPAESEAETQDFILINHPVFFIDDPQDYLKLVKRGTSSNPVMKLTAPLALGVKGALIARAISSKKIANPLHARYWSMVPYRLGDDAHKQAIKFSTRPCSAHNNERVPSSADPNYLRKTMAQTLAAGDACFDFLVQTRTPSMKVEDSKTEWKETESPFIKVATITIPTQTFDSEVQMAFGENLSFTPWHSLPEHRPLGGVNRVRRIVYEETSKVRHELNRAPRKEPSSGDLFPAEAVRR